jgi:hypothetical protein
VEIVAEKNKPKKAINPWLIFGISSGVIGTLIYYLSRR